MFDLPLFLAFVVAAVILTITPGLDTAMVLRASLSSHARVAFSAAAGILLGCLAWGAAVSLGLGVLLHTSEVLYAVVKFAGAGYLVWLGIGLLFKPRTAVSDGGGRSALQAKTAFRQGLVTNLLNPKIGIFYVSFIPQFIPAGANVATYSFFLCIVHVALTLVWFIALILAARKFSLWLQKPTVVTRLDQLTGGVFIGFGVKLALSQH